MLKHGGIIVHVDDPRARIMLPCQFVNISLRRQSGPDIHELAYALFPDEE